MEGDLHAGSSPAFGIMPSCVVVARGTLDPLALVRIQARQPLENHVELGDYYLHHLVLQGIFPYPEYGKRWIKLIAHNFPLAQIDRANEKSQYTP